MPHQAVQPVSHEPDAGQLERHDRETKRHANEADRDAEGDESERDRHGEPDDDLEERPENAHRSSPMKPAGPEARRAVFPPIFPTRPATHQLQPSAQ